jgi:hypothetical protein
MRLITTILYFTTFLLACIGTPSGLHQPTALNKPVEEQAELNGSLMIVDGGMMILIREEKKAIIRTRLIAKNDSIKDIVQCSYDERIDNGCRLGMEPWISFTGKYLRNDTLQSIFLYSNVKLLDDCSACSLISEE